jgi:hypothetical protein
LRGVYRSGSGVQGGLLAIKIRGLVVQGCIGVPRQDLTRPLDSVTGADAARLGTGPQLEVLRAVVVAHSVAVVDGLARREETRVRPPLHRLFAAPVIDLQVWHVRLAACFWLPHRQRSGEREAGHRLWRLDGVKDTPQCVHQRSTTRAPQTSASWIVPKASTTTFDTRSECTACTWPKNIGATGISSSSTSSACR